MKKEHINRKIKLLRSGFTEADIARMLGITRQAISNEMRGDRKSVRVREALCRLTKTPFEKFFPEHSA